ncbi:MAG: hypothetical protein EP329_22310 [Deltaproteobacteria bacterium]|nr:MAG: hypothetical protein EP329_22310 [Deltaproteobacteria bacterium]
MRRAFVTAVSTLFTCALVASGCSDTSSGGVGDGTAGDDTASHDVAGDDVADTQTGDDSSAPTDTTGAETDTTGGVDTLIGTDTTVPADTHTSGCEPGETVCDSPAAYVTCLPDGSGYGAPTDCEADEECRSGACKVRCPNDPKFGSYVGCEFWSTDLPNYPDPTLNPTPENLPWALVVSNPGTFNVRVAFEMPPLFTYVPEDDTVPPRQSRVFLLPNINVEGTSIRPKGVHLTATGAVLVHQFNPWDNTFSNDASLLLPDPMLGTDYVVMSMQSGASEIEVIPGFTFPNQNGYFTVIAAFDATDVTFQVTGPVRASGPIPKLGPGDVFTIRINRGDVLSIQSDPETLGESADLTGSRVTSSKPVAVFGGHEEAVLGYEYSYETHGPTDKFSCCADHLEDQMLPLELLSNRYLAVHSPPRGTTYLEPDIWRIAAAEAGVVIHTSPPQAGADGVTLGQVGAWVEVQTAESFEVTANGKIQVAQYLVGQTATEQYTGDPSLVMMVPTDRFRKDYIISMPDSYSRNILVVVKPNAASVTVDDVAVTETFTMLGGTGYGYAYVETTPGVHVVSSDDKFGLTVYGYNGAVSFSTIGGIAGPGE